VCFEFLFKVWSEAFLIIRGIQRDMINDVHWFYIKYTLSSAAATKLKLFRQFFEIYSNIKFHKTLSSFSRVFTRGKTEGQTYMTKLIVAFRNWAKASTKLSFRGRPYFFKVNICSYSLPVSLDRCLFTDHFPP
jgi:hypothetical protein